MQIAKSRSVSFPRIKLDVVKLHVVLSAIIRFNIILCLIWVEKFFHALSVHQWYKPVISILTSLSLKDRSFNKKWEILRMFRLLVEKYFERFKFRIWNHSEQTWPTRWLMVRTNVITLLLFVSRISSKGTTSPATENPIYIWSLTKQGHHKLVDVSSYQDPC